MLSTEALVELMNRHDTTVPRAVGAEAEAIAALVDDVVERTAAGGRLVYVGAGTSGGLAALDAAECRATFSAAPGQVIALVAGAGLSSPEQDAAEEDAGAGAADIRAAGVCAADAVVGVSASGRTPYVLGALEVSAAEGALTACVVSAPESDLARAVQHEICMVLGPEVIAGSTRLKAGTAQKLVLNTLSTAAMVRLGKTYGNLMIDVRAGTEKLRARARRAVELAAGVSADEADNALEAAGGSAKVAVVSLLAGIEAESARARLERCRGNIRAALAP